jgi:hypothetical protein
MDDLLVLLEVHQTASDSGRTVLARAWMALWCCQRARLANCATTSGPGVGPARSFVDVRVLCHQCGREEVGEQLRDARWLVVMDPVRGGEPLDAVQIGHVIAVGLG